MVETPEPPEGSDPLLDRTLSSSSSYVLLQRAQGGDREAIAQVFARYLPRLKSWSSGRLPSGARRLADTDDLIQETMVKAVDRIGSFEIRGAGAFLAYLRSAMMNRIRDEIRRAKRRPGHETLDDQVEDALLSPLDRTIGQKAVDSYETALSRLKDEERQAVVARIELGCSYDEIAEALGKPSPDAARMTVSRALVRLAKEMGHER
ncbi:MAG: sigma-70 family RNA polymerase sigma factor [Candidatus Eisenbacteria bacterium]|nr:sigma-70 family RNA polymerase sigma factor [Candidatus Eisenbacteria bacterium]MCC7142960.1 sigma-70 family RNA polymerase sigma factor [Candidatus Eisenbacteria bacterium]